MVIIFRILIEQSCQVKILVIIKIMFSTILDLVRRLVKLITTLVEFLLRLSVVSEQMVDSLQTAPEDVRQPQLAGAEQGVACRIAEVQEEDMSYVQQVCEVIYRSLPWDTPSSCMSLTSGSTMELTIFGPPHSGFDRLLKSQNKCSCKCTIRVCIGYFPFLD